MTLRRIGLIGALAAASLRAQSPMSAAQLKWLNEDAVYILTDQERSAFAALETGEQRDKFIRDFWESRGGESFRKNYYTRIAYADRNFAFGDRAGSKSDRGRAYIRYGPPDEIEDHSQGGFARQTTAEGSGQTLAYPSQRWHYRNGADGHELVLEFVDRAMNGEFRLTADPRDKEVVSHVAGIGDIRPGEKAALAFGAAETPAIGALSIQVAPGSAAIELPVVNPAHEFHILGRVMTPSHQAVSTFEEACTGQAIYRKTLALSPGSYRLVLIVKDLKTGTIARRDSAFDVK